MQTQSNPFMTGCWGGQPVGAVCAGDRIRMVKNFSLEEIDQALQVHGLQKSVIAALNRRRRQLIKEQQS